MKPDWCVSAGGVQSGRLRAQYQQQVLFCHLDDPSQGPLRREYSYKEAEAQAFSTRCMTSLMINSLCHLDTGLHLQTDRLYNRYTSSWARAAATPTCPWRHQAGELQSVWVPRACPLRPQ